MEKVKSFFRYVNYSVWDIVDCFVDRTMIGPTLAWIISLAQIATSAFVTENQHYL